MKLLAVVTVAVLTAAATHADPLRSVASAELREGKSPIASCGGMAFLPDGKRVVVRSEWQADVGANVEGRIVVVGPAGGPMTTPISVPPRGGRLRLYSPRLAVSKTGVVLTPGESEWLLRRTFRGGADADLPGRVILGDSVAGGGVTHLWLVGAKDTLYVEDGGDRTAYRLNVVSGDPLKDGRGRAKVILSGGTPEDAVAATDFHHSGRLFAVGLSALKGGNARIDCWQVGEQCKKLSATLADPASALAIHPDAKSIAVGLESGEVVRLATSDLTPVRDATKVCRFTVGALAYHPEGRFLACGTNDGKGASNLVVLDTLTDEVLLRFAADPIAVSAVCFNADGSRMATFGGSGRVTIWDSSSLSLKQTRNGVLVREVGVARRPAGGVVP